MSASKKKQIRKEQYMSERQRKEAEEQKKLKRYTVTFWIVLVLCLCTVVTATLVNPVKNIVYRNTVAVTIGQHELNAVELNYFYIDAINNYCSEYSYIISYLIDTASPLNAASNTDSTGATWADKFLDMAIENVKSIYQLYDTAIAKGFELPEDEKTGIDTMMSNLEIYAQYYGYNNADAYLRAMYGNGSNAENYRAYYEVCTIADCYYNEYYDSLEYTDADLRAYEADKMWEYNAYTYAYYYFDYTKFVVNDIVDEDGKASSSDEAKDAAREVAKLLAEELAAGEYADLDAFDNAINAMLTEYFGDDTEDEKKDDTATQAEETEKTEDDTEDEKEEEKLKYQSTKIEDTLYSKVNSLFADWIRGKDDTDEEESDDKEEDKEEVLVERKEGDLTIITNESGSGDSKTVNGYYVLRFGSVNDNTYSLKNVRHLLVSYEGGTYSSTTGVTTYTDAEKAAAKAEAEKLLAEFETTGKTEDDFAALAKEHSTDTGSKEDGGLYEDVYPGQMVEPFEDWCYDESRKPGDYGMVQTDYGWHIMFFVGDSETNYRDFMVENANRNEDVTEWMEALVEAAVLDKKNLKYVDMDMILSTN